MLFCNDEYKSNKPRSIKNTPCNAEGNNGADNVFELDADAVQHFSLRAEPLDKQVLQPKQSRRRHTLHQMSNAEEEHRCGWGRGGGESSVREVLCVIWLLVCVSTHANAPNTHARTHMHTFTHTHTHTHIHTP